MTDTSGFGAIRSLDYVIVPCDDLAAMRRFYTEVLRFTILDEDQDWVGLQVGSLFLGLRPRGRAYDGPPSPDTSAGIQLSFRVPPADVDLAYVELQGHGIEVIEAPIDQDWPHRTLFFHDPEHNIIEIYADIHTDDTMSTPSGVHEITDR